jgi:hypothetical protein
MKRLTDVNSQQFRLGRPQKCMVRLIMLQPGSTLRRLTVLALVVGGLCLSIHNPTRADIVVKGSVGEKADELNVWCAHHIPACFRPKSDVVVRQLTDSEMNAYLNSGNPGNQNDRSGNDDSNDDIDGVFENDPARITLRLPNTGQLDMFTFAHEYGHFVWFNLMSRDDHKKYEAIYNHQRAVHHLVTRYASTDLEEGFAEAFSFYVGEPEILQHRDAASYDFLAAWEQQAEQNRNHD